MDGDGDGAELFFFFFLTFSGRAGCWEEERGMVRMCTTCALPYLRWVLGGGDGCGCGSLETFLDIVLSISGPCG